MICFYWYAITLITSQFPISSASLSATNALAMWLNSIWAIWPATTDSRTWRRVSTKRLLNPRRSPSTKTRRLQNPLPLLNPSPHRNSQMPRGFRQRQDPRIHCSKCRTFWRRLSGNKEVIRTDKNYFCTFLIVSAQYYMFYEMINDKGLIRDW